MTGEDEPYPSWTHEGCSYDEIFPATFLLELSGLMQLRPTPENQLALRQGHLAAVAAFVSAVHDMERAQPIHAENDRLDEVARDAARLMRSLGNLYEFGDAAARLAQEIEMNPTAYSGDGGINLSRLLDRVRGYPFYHLTHLLSDLWASAERAQIRHDPSQDEKWEKLLERADAEDLADAEGLTAFARAVMTDKLPPTGPLAKGQKLHRPKGKPYVALIEGFATTWAALGAGAYGAGHTVPGLQGSKSRAVDALHLTARRLYPETTRANIATAFRNLEKSRRQVSQNLGQ